MDSKDIIDIMVELNRLTGTGIGTINEAELAYRESESHFKNLDRYLKILQAELEIHYEDMSAWKAKNKSLTHRRYLDAIKKIHAAHTEFSIKKTEYNCRKTRLDVLMALLIAEQSLAKLGGKSG